MELIFTLATYLGIAGIVGFQLRTGLTGARTGDRLRTLQLYLFLLFLSSELSRPFFPVYAAGLGGGLANREFAAALPQIVWGLSALVATPLGWLFARRLGMHNLCRVTALATVAALALTALTDNYWAMLVCRAVVSAGYGIANVVAAIYLLGLGARAGVMAVLLAAVALASVCGNALGGLLVNYVSYATVFWLSAGCAVLAAGVLRLARVAEPEDSGAPAEAATQRPVAYGALLRNGRIQLFALLSTMPYRFVLTGCVLYLLPVQLTRHHLSLSTVGQVMMVYFLLNYVLVAPIAAWLDRVHAYRTVAVAGPVLTGAGLLVLGTGVDHLPTLFLAVAVLSVGMALNNSIQLPIVPLVFREECARFGQDALVAYFRTVERVGSVLGPLLTALLYGWWGDNVLCLTGLVLVGLAVPLAGLLALATRCGAVSPLAAPPQP